MSTICAEQQHKIFPSHQLLMSSNRKLPFKDLEIPPRKLLTKSSQEDILSPSLDMSGLRKYLPYNDHHHDNDFSSDDDMDPYSSDHFRMYEFKVRRCTRSRSHDWTDCPFAHPGEKARRRDPRRYHYSGVVCPEFRRGGCSRGDNCELSHGVFECWLHPSRYRTEACKDGKNCKRKVCFFAHSPRELRILPEVSSLSYIGSSGGGGGHSCCCGVCHSIVSSPTSTLLGVSSHVSPPLSPSQSLSPPLSPVKTSHRGFSRCGDRLSKLGSGVMSYKDVLTELMSSLEAMNMVESTATVAAVNNNNPWIDCSFNGEDYQQQQLILSPSTPSPSGGPGNFFNGDCSSKAFINFSKINDNNGNNVNNGGGLASPDPDLGWVNELLM